MHRLKRKMKDKRDVSNNVIHQASREAEGAVSPYNNSKRSDISNDPNFDDHGAVIFHGAAFDNSNKHVWTRNNGAFTAVPAFQQNTRRNKSKNMLRQIFCCIKAPNHPSTSVITSVSSPGYGGNAANYRNKTSRTRLPEKMVHHKGDAKPKISFIEWLLPNTAAARRRRAEVGDNRNRGALGPSPRGPASRRLLNDFLPRSDQETFYGNSGTGAPTSLFAHERLLLPPLAGCDADKNTLIVDLDETLVHSSFKPIQSPDFVVPVEIDGVVHNVYVAKRPHVDEFLKRISHAFECVMFTASLAKYADPVVNHIDQWRVFRSRLFREACVFNKGNYVKDLERLGRDLRRVIIIDNSPASYAMHPENAIPVQSWFGDGQDTELLDLLPFLEKLAQVDNVYNYLSGGGGGQQTTQGRPGILNNSYGSKL